MKSTLLFLVSLISLQAFSTEGDGSNPGDWKMMPTAVAKEESGYYLKIRNLDLFEKTCSLKVKWEGHTLLFEKQMRFLATRSQDIKLNLLDQLLANAPSEANEMSSLLPNYESLDIDIACVKPKEGQSLNEYPTLSSSACFESSSDCQQICEASSSAADACVNDHLLVNFLRDSWKVTESSRGWTASGLFVHSEKAPLECQIVITAKIDGSSGETSFIVAPSKQTIFNTNKSKRITWNFSKAEAGIGHEIDLSHPRVVGLCSKSATVVTGGNTDDWYKSCDPLKRPECNWIVPIDSLETER